MYENEKSKSSEWIFENLTAAARMASRIYTLYISIAIYAIVTVISVSDRQILLDERVMLPLLRIEVPLTGLLLFLPAAILLMYAYLHIYLSRVKGLITQSKYEYFQIPKRRLYPWMLLIAEDPEAGFNGFIQITIAYLSRLVLPVIALALLYILSRKMNNIFLSFYSFLSFSIILAIMLYQTHNDREAEFAKLAKVIGFKAKRRRIVNFILYLFLDPIVITLLISLIIIVFNILFLLHIFPIDIPFAPARPYFNLNYQKLVTAPALDFEGSYWEYLDSVVLYKANMNYTDIRHSRMQYANLIRVHAQNANFEGCLLSNAGLAYAFFHEAIFTNAILDSAVLNGSDFSDVTAIGATMIGVSAKKTIFREADLSNCNFVNANLHQADFRKADLSKCDFRGANLRYANLDSANVRYINVKGADLTGAHLVNVDGLDLANILSHAASLQGAQLDRDVLIGLMRRGRFRQIPDSVSQSYLLY